jgi:hypothetical protein
MAMAQQQFQTMALQIVDGLDGQHDAYVARVLSDLKTLKDNPERLKDLTVSDTDYELKPPRPEIKRAAG